MSFRSNNPPGKFTKAPEGKVPGSGRLLGLWLDSIPTAKGEPIAPPLDAEEIEKAAEILDRRAEKENRG
ncbi:MULTISPECIES: hypothetical protein [Actinomycetes]|uniref:Uncharacterized protein n=2 Tax=Actinomycetes TaxID=1760 RepID=A0ABW1I2C2_9ACTN